MPVPVYSVGQVLGAADVNSWFVPLSAVATTDQTTTSGTAINDNTLSVAVAASANYAVELYVRYTTSGTILGNFTGPSGATLSLCPAQNTNDINIATPWSIGGTTGGSDFSSFAIGSLVTSSTAGTLQFQFYSSAGGTAVTRLARSRLTLQRIG